MAQNGRPNTGPDKTLPAADEYLILTWAHAISGGVSSHVFLQ